MFILEGNIGAGKSTLLKYIGMQLHDTEVSFEPLQQWQSRQQSQSLLAHFYANPHRWAYTMETLTLMCRVHSHRRDQERPSTSRLIIERSVYSGYYCFAANGYEQGFMTPGEWHMYSEYFNFLVAGACRPPRGLIYIRVDPEVSYARIAQRSRSDESAISSEYLAQIHARHDAYLIDKRGVLPELRDVPVLVLDANDEFERDPQVLQRHVSAIERFITNLV
jgi:deoxyadenosine/deoxycytidine kinase